MTKEDIKFCERVNYIVDLVKNQSFIWDTIMSFSSEEYEVMNAILEEETGKRITRLGVIYEANER